MGEGISEEMSEVKTFFDIEKWAKKRAEYECMKLINKILNKLERAYINYIVGHKNRVITLQGINIDVNVTIEREGEGIHVHIYIAVPKSEVDRVCNEIFHDILRKRKDIQLWIRAREKLYEGEYKTTSGELKDVV